MHFNALLDQSTGVEANHTCRISLLLMLVLSSALDSYNNKDILLVVGFNYNLYSISTPIANPILKDGLVYLFPNPTQTFWVNSMPHMIDRLILKKSNPNLTLTLTL